MKKKKIIITGANGFLGSSLTNYFSKKNYELTCVYNRNIKKKIKKKNIKYIKQNLLKKIPISRFKGNFNALLHFAGPKNDRASVTNNSKIFKDAIKLDKNVIQFCLKKKIKCFIYASSSAVYDLNEGKKRNKNNFKETNTNSYSNPDGSYGRSKLKIENYLINIGQKKLKSTSCRIFSIYGKNTKTIINIWKKNIIKNKQINIWGKEEIIRSWLYIDDFLKAIEIILNNKKILKVVNIGSDEKTSLKDIIKIIMKKYKIRNVKILKIKNFYPGPKIRYANKTKLLKLGWKQKFNLFSGLEKIT